MQEITYQNKNKKPQKSSFIITLTEEELDGIEKLPNHARAEPIVAQGGEENKKNHAQDKNEEEGEEKV